MFVDITQKVFGRNLDQAPSTDG